MASASKVVVFEASEPLVVISWRQFTPQRVFVELDPSDRSLSTGIWEQNDTVPVEVWNGLVRRYTIAVPPTMKAVNTLLDYMVPLAERVLDGFEAIWDGRNTVGKLTEDALRADAELTELAEQFSRDEDNWAHWWQADDYLLDEADGLRERIAAGEPLDKIEQEWQGEGEDDDAPLLMGLTRYLEQLQRQVREGRLM